MKTNEYILDLVNRLGVPYLDVTCYRAHKEIYRQTIGDGACGNELLHMYSCSKVITVTSALRLIEDGKMAEAALSNVWQNAKLVSVLINNFVFLLIKPVYKLFFEDLHV